MEFTVKQLKAFVAVAQYRSFAQAGEAIHLSQPALSIAIKKLEDQLGGKLLHRSTRSLTLTPEGEALLPVAQRLLQDWRGAYNDMHQRFALQRGRLSLACMPSLAAAGFPNVIARFHQQYPEIDISLEDIVMEDVVSALLDGEVEDEKLNEVEFQMFFLMLIAAGNESTRSVTAHGMRLLMENPEQLQLLVDKPELIPDACEEMLRYNPAFIAMRRTATQDTELGGKAIKKGDKILLHWHSINMDDAVFDNAIAFDITRPQRMPELYREHRAFGVGQHFCLGSHLARLELQVMFEELIPRLRNPVFAEPVQYMRDFFVNGIKSMPITFDIEVA